jgi:hypothetical protein
MLEVCVGLSQSNGRDARFTFDCRTGGERRTVNEFERDLL